MPRLRRRLDALQGDAHNTMAVLRAVLQEFEDGIAVKLVRTGQGTILDFLGGKIDELPLKIIIDASDDKPEKG